MKKIRLVVDSSVIVKWINSQNEKLLLESDWILQDMQNGKVDILAPELAKYEIGNALLYKKIILSNLKTSLASLFAIPIKYIPFDLELSKLTMEIACENGITYYDASFLALAYKTNSVLITDNPKHQKKLAKIKIEVISLKDYKKLLSS